MADSSLLALSPLDGRYRAGLAPLARLFSEYGLLRARAGVEARYVQALLAELAHPLAGPEHAEAWAAWSARIARFDLADAEAVKAHEARTRHDVKAVEYWLKDTLTAYPTLEGASEWIHFGLTSEDVNALAYGTLLAEARETVLLPALADWLTALGAWAKAYKGLPMPARTHGQPASPTTLGKEFGVFGLRFAQGAERLAALPIHGKLNGATGTFAALHAAFPERDWIAFSERFVAGLGLTPQPLTTQIESHDGLGAFLDALKGLAAVGLDFAQDAWRYVSDGYLVQAAVEGEIGSSTMPHKVNPIDFENAEGNWGLAIALTEHMARKLPVSRLQRDLSDSTVLRNLGVALGHWSLALTSLSRGLGRVAPDAARLEAELAAHPEVLAEAIQTLMRAAGSAAPYERLLALTRGRQASLEELRALARELPAPFAERAAALTPAAYVGLAPKLAADAAVRLRVAAQRLQKREKQARSPF